MNRLALIGGGQHARVVAEAARLAGWTVLGVVSRAEIDGLALLGDDAWLDAALAADSPAIRDCRWLVAIGDVAIRRRLASAWGPRLAWATVIHPAATVSATAAIAPGAFVGARAVLQAGAAVAAHAIINTGAIVEHDCRIGEGAHLAPGAVLGGGVAVGAWATVALGAHVRDHVAIGDGALVAMGSVVVCEVAAGSTVMGCPAREGRP